MFLPLLYSLILLSHTKEDPVLSSLRGQSFLGVRVEPDLRSQLSGIFSTSSHSSLILSPHTKEDPVLLSLIGIFSMCQSTNLFFVPTLSGKFKTPSLSSLIILSRQREDPHHYSVKAQAFGFIKVSLFSSSRPDPLVQAERGLEDLLRHKKFSFTL